ncbi:MAG: aldolase/citrate lyase family protein [Acidobacteria bacterium]|nr:aldolase/citrate lyase family protein [Acidobacteriota bacterium]
MMNADSMHVGVTTWSRFGRGLAVCVVALGALCASTSAHAQAPTRLNKVIDAIENGQAAVANEHWRFVDMEHSPFSGELVQSVLGEMDQDRDPDGRMRLAPLVRIPQEGDEDFKWAVKQVLDIGGYGVILPHVDTKEEALRFVRSMRYPPQKSSSAPAEPRGERGWGPGGAMRLWGMGGAEYAAKADVWPLNPDGELFAVAMIESQEAVDNIHEILEAPISAIMVIPGDMAMDLGLGPNPSERNHPEVDANFDTVLKACQAQTRVICGAGDGRVRTQQRLAEGWMFFLPL